MTYEVWPIRYLNDCHHEQMKNLFLKIRTLIRLVPKLPRGIAMWFQWTFRRKKQCLKSPSRSTFRCSVVPAITDYPHHKILSVPKLPRFPLRRSSFVHRVTTLYRLWVMGISLNFYLLLCSKSNPRKEADSDPCKVKNSTETTKDKWKRKTSTSAVQSSKLGSLMKANSGKLHWKCVPHPLVLHRFSSVFN